MPPYRRDQPASSAAAVNVGQVSVTSFAGVPTGWLASFGSNLDEPAVMVALAPNVSVPRNAWNTTQVAPLNVECPDTYSGNGGVTTLSAWYGRHCSAGTWP